MRFNPIPLIVKLFRRKKPELVIIKRDPCRLRMSEWRSNKALVSTARSFLDNPDFRLLLDVCRTESPGNVMLVDDFNTPNRVRATWQARNEGYGMALNNIEQLGVYEEPKTALEAEFAAPEGHQ